MPAINLERNMWIAMAVCGFFTLLLLLVAAVAIFYVKKKQCSLQMPWSSKLFLFFSVLPGLVLALGDLINWTLYRASSPTVRGPEWDLVACGGLILFVPIGTFFLLQAVASLKAGEQKLSALAGFSWNMLSLVLACVVLGCFVGILILTAIFSGWSLV